MTASQTTERRASQKRDVALGLGATLVRGAFFAGAVALGFLLIELDRKSVV